ncbi:MAG: hypothetical protein ACJ750_13255 [Gaiellaceae bacterium]
MAEGSDRQVELTTAPQGFRLDISGDLAEQVRDAFGREEVRQAPQLAYPSAVTYPGKDSFPGRYVLRFAEVWNAIAAGWATRQKGPTASTSRRIWPMSAIVFITEDKRLLVMCNRLREEHGFPIVAMNLADYLRQRRA